MNRLYLTFFGRFQATQNDTPVKISAPKSQGLLAWLTLQPEQRASREALAALLWSTSDEQRAQQNLRSTLSRLRRSLGGVIHSTRWQVEMNQSGWGSDLSDFLAAINEQRLRDAVALYQGPLLSGLSTGSPAFDEWLLLERERFQRHYLQALAQLTADAFDQDAYADALNFASLTIDTDPFDELAYCDMMEAYALLNRPREAIALYERLETLLSAELNLAPSAETTAILQQITDGSYSTRRTRLAASTEPPPHNLPRQHSRFIGRVALKERAVKRLGDPNCQLLTLVGIGGAGKTRLSLAIGSDLLAQFADGVWFVPLEDANSEAEIVERVATAAGISLSPRLVKQADRLAAVVDQLRTRSLLLLLDNYESVIDHVAFVQALIAEAPKVKLLVTSRSTLRLQSEWVIDVDGLTVPPEAADLDAGSFEAVELFNEVASRISAETTLSSSSAQQSIAQITRDVGGIPLAIELAAAWCRSFSAEQIAERIASSLDFLASQMRDATPRHRSMRAVLEQTWQMLTDAEQLLFSQLAVFENGFDLTAAQSILGTSAAQLGDLVDRFLLRDDNGRFTLHPLVGQFAQAKWQQLTNSERKGAKQSHTDHYVQWIASVEALYEPDVRRMMQPDMDNVRRAWREASASHNLQQLESAQPNFFAYHDFVGSYEVLVTLFEESERQLHENVPHSNAVATRRAFLLIDMAHVRHKFSRMEEALALAEAARDLAQQSENAEAYVRASARMMGSLNSLGKRDAIEEMGKSALSFVAADDDEGRADIYVQLSTTALMSGDGETARQHSERDVALRRSLDNPPRLAVSLLYLGFAYGSTGRLQDEVDTISEAYELLKQSKILYETCTAGNNLAAALSELGQYQQAITLYEEVLGHARRLNEKRMISVILSNLGDIQRHFGLYEQAETHIKEGLALGESIDDVLAGLYNREGLGWVYACMGAFEQGHVHLELAIEGYRDGGWNGRLLDATIKRGELALWSGDLRLANELAATARQLLATLNDPSYVPMLNLLDGFIALEQEKWDAARSSFHAAQQVREAGRAEFRLLNALAGEAWALHRDGELANAMVIVEKLLDLRVLDEASTFMYVACVEVLRASGDAREGEILAEGLAKLARISAEISSPKRRSTYLNKLPYNKRLADLNPAA